MLRITRAASLAYRLRHARRGHNIGGHNEWANLDIVRLRRAMDERFAQRDDLAARFPRAPQAHGEQSESLIEFVTDRAGHDWRYAIDASKIERELGLCRPRPSSRDWLKLSTGIWITRPGGVRLLSPKCWMGAALRRLAVQRSFHTSSRPPGLYQRPEVPDRLGWATQHRCQDRPTPASARSPGGSNPCTYKKVCVVAQYIKSVRKTGWHPQLLMVLCAECDAMPLSETGRVWPAVHHNIKYRSRQYLQTSLPCGFSVWRCRPRRMPRRAAGYLAQKVA